MKRNCGGFRLFAGVLAVFCSLALGGIAYGTGAVPDEMDRAAVADYDGHSGFSLRRCEDTVAVSIGAPSSRMLTLWGIIPVKTVRVLSGGPRQVVLGGTPFGCVLNLKGVLVVGFADVKTADGVHNPAREAGLKTGDVLTAVNDAPLRDTSALADLVVNGSGQSVRLRYTRGEEEHTTTLTPAYSVDDRCYKLGLWVRDSEAGVGMLSFCDEESGICVGLGHALKDADTGTDFAMSEGEAYHAQILSVEKGTAGSPGQLSGCIQAGQPLGPVLENDVNGVYCVAQTTIGSRTAEVAAAEEVQRGEAVMLAAIDGAEPKEYRVQIDHIHTGAADGKNMRVHVMDAALLDLTGGIVQGMSGSPILQNGKLVGVLTHVLVDDPTSGYAIFADTMLATARSLVAGSLDNAS